MLTVTGGGVVSMQWHAVDRILASAFCSCVNSALRSGLALGVADVASVVLSVHVDVR